MHEDYKHTKIIPTSVQKNVLLLPPLEIYEKYLLWIESCSSTCQEKKNALTLAVYLEPES